MSGTVSTGAGDYTLAELAAALGVNELEAADVLDEHGYAVPAGDERLSLTADDYTDLMTGTALDEETGQ
ncbi:MAG: hypothetical protein ACTHMA_21015 [Thermomicrobiales bacterium]